MPVSIADSSSTTDRNSGIVKKIPDCRKNWKPNSVRPPVSCRTRRIDGASSGSPPFCSRRWHHSRNVHRGSRPPEISQITGDVPARVGASALGWTRPHSPALRIPSTNSAMPLAESTAPTTSMRGRLAGGGDSAIRRIATRKTTTTMTSPANTQRQDA